MPASSFGRLLRASILLSVSCLCLSALPLLAAKGCSLPKSWSSPVYPNASLTFPFLMPNDLTNSSECQVLAYNTSLLPADPSTHIVGYDVATGKQKWRYLLSDGKNGRDWEILPAYSTTGPYDHIFQTTWKYNGCGKGPNDLLLNITRLSYDRNHGLKRVWTISLGCDPFGYVQTFVFPASAKRPELLLVVGTVEWLTVDAHTGAALNRQPAPFGEITIMGDSSAHQFVAIVRDDDTHSSIISYQLSTDGMWQQLAVTQYDSYTYREMEVNAYGIEYASRGVVLVLQQYPQYDQLIGINALTGKQQWSASNYPLLDGSWIDAYPDFSFGGASLEPHPLRSEYVIISSSGYNSSTREAIFAFGLLDSMTGSVIATSPATQVQYHEKGGYDEIIGEWQTVDNGGILIRRMHSFSYSTNYQYWVALNSTTLKIISQGTLPTLPNVDAFSGVIAVDAQRGEFSFVATMNTIVYDPVTVGGATIVGQRIKATNGEDRTENPTDRHRHARRPSSLRSLASKA